MGKYKLINNYGETIKTSNSIDVLNKHLRSIDNVKASLTATDVDWITGKKEVLKGYNYTITTI